MSNIFPLPLDARYISEGIWELIKPFIYNNPPIKIIIPTRFRSDGASIPKIFWSIIGSPWTGKYTRSCLPHDYGYIVQVLSRKKVDQIFYDSMRIEGVSFAKRWIMYHGVRLTAWRVWNKRRNQKYAMKAYLDKLETLSDFSSLSNTY